MNEITFRLIKINNLETINLFFIILFGLFIFVAISYCLYNAIPHFYIAFAVCFKLTLCQFCT